MNSNSITKSNQSSTTSANHHKSTNPYAFFNDKLLLGFLHCLILTKIEKQIEYLCAIITLNNNSFIQLHSNMNNLFFLNELQNRSTFFCLLLGFIFNLFFNISFPQLILINFPVFIVDTHGMFKCLFKLKSKSLSYFQAFLV